MSQLPIVALDLGQVTVGLERDGMIVAGQLSSGPGEFVPAEGYATVRPFYGISLREVQGYGKHFETGSRCDETDDQLMEHLNHLAL